MAYLECTELIKKMTTEKYGEKYFYEIVLKEDAMIKAVLRN